MKLIRLVMTEVQHQKIKKILFPGDGLEAAVILVCNQGTGENSRRLIVSDILSLPHKCSKRDVHSLSWPFAKHLPPDEISKIDRLGQSIITIHSHPEGCDNFSPVDDRNDKELFRSVCNWFTDKRPVGSAIMLSNGKNSKIKARTVDSDGKFTSMESVSVIGHNIQIWKKDVKQKKQTAYESKLSQTFGTGTLNLLRSLQVGVVGCSGTGSILIELLARNCIGNLVLVDNDVVEEKNLNRILNTTAKDASKKESKALTLKKAIEKIGLKTKVKAYQDVTDSLNVVSSLIDCDIIFGAVDSAYGRYHLDCLASAYFIPYFDVGVHLETDDKGRITAADAVSHYIHPEGNSLLSRGAYTIEQVTAETIIAKPLIIMRKIE